MSSADTWKITSDWATVHACKPATEHSLQVLLDVLHITGDGGSSPTSAQPHSHTNQQVLPTPAWRTQSPLQPTCWSSKGPAAMSSCLHWSSASPRLTLAAAYFPKTKTCKSDAASCLSSWTSVPGMAAVVGTAGIPVTCRTRVLALDRVLTTQRQQLSTAAMRLADDVVQQARGKMMLVAPLNLCLCFCVSICVSVFLCVYVSVFLCFRPCVCVPAPHHVG